MAAIEQRYYLVNEKDKAAALMRLFEVEPITSAIVFSRTRVGSSELAAELAGRGYPAESLSGDLSQEARNRVMQRFKNHQIEVLVATDVAARGLDIDDISHVINYDSPSDPEVYIHRIGRTGRAGKTGVAILLLTPKEQWQRRRIENFTGQTVQRGQLPTDEDIHNHRDAILMEQVNRWLLRNRCRKEMAMAAELVEAGHDPLTIAAVALKLARADEKQRPIPPIGEVREMEPPRPRFGGDRSDRRPPRERGFQSFEKGMVRLSLSTGKRNGVSVHHVVGALSHQAEIPGNVIGKINIQDNRTFVDMPEPFVDQVLAKSGTYRIGRRAISVSLA